MRASLVVWAALGLFITACPIDPGGEMDAEVDAPTDSPIEEGGRPDRSPGCTDGCPFCQMCVNGQCQPRSDGMSCNEGRCYQGECCTGCWDGVECRPGNTSTSCGGGGQDCEVCPCEGDQCEEGACRGVANVREVSAGESHTCAVLESGEVFCWGRNVSGALGVGTQDASSNTPMLVTLPAAQSITAGTDFSCAVTADKARYCWGLNEDGQLGLGDLGAGTDRSTPETFGPTDWAKVVAGSMHACGIGSGGSLRCWGRNFEGQLGLGTTVPSPAPAVVMVDEAPMGVIDISLGEVHTCAIREGNLIYSWGGNQQAQLGLGRGGLTRGRTSPTLVSPDSNWLSVSSGRLHNLSRRSNDSLYVFGNNSSGQLGTGDVVARTRPWQVGFSAWSVLSAGGEHSCGVTGDALFCWGDNEHGQLGTGGRMDARALQRVGTFGGWTAVSLGGDHSCGIRGGGLYCWGLGAEGRLGIGDESDTLTPRRVCLVP